MKKFIVWIFILLLIVSFVAFKAKNRIVKSILENATKSLTNLRLNIEDVDTNIGQHNLTLKNLKLYNPPGFEKAVMIDMPLVHIDYNLAAAMRRKIHFYTLKIDLKELLVIRNRKGHLNFMYIKGLKKPGAQKKEKKKDFKIDKLYLSVGKVIYKDYFKNNTPVVKIYNVNTRNQLFENVDDTKALVSSIIYRALIQTDIFQLLNFNINILEENLKDVIDKGGLIIKQFQSKATQTIKDATKDLKQTVRSLFIKEKE